MSLRRSAARVIAATATAAALFAGRTAPAQQGDPAPAGNLSARYKLVERFSTQEGRPGFVGQYQVAFRETLSSSDQGGYSRTIQFSERPASVPDERRVTELVRRYDSFQSKPAVVNNKGGQRPLDGLTIFCREVPGKPPLVISLTPNRTLQEKEYEFATANSYVDKLTFVLGEEPVRLADSWPVGAAGIFALTNLPEVVEGSLEATLSEVRAHPGGTGLLAVIDVTGRLQQDPQMFGDNDTAVRARLNFAFTPAPATAGGDANVVYGFGRIEKLSLAQVRTVAPPPPAKKSWIKRELELERRFPGKDALLAIPEPPPTATVENSWLVATSARDEYHFRHPQEYALLVQPQMTVLKRPVAENLRDDFIAFTFYPKAIRPEAAFDELKAEWAQKKIDVIPGLTHRLPEVDWPDMAVHHMEAVLKDPTPVRGDAGAASPRRYSDCYVIQFSKNVSLVVGANTFSEKHAQFQKEVEAILKTVKLGAP